MTLFYFFFFWGNSYINTYCFVTICFPQMTIPTLFTSDTSQRVCIAGAIFDLYIIGQSHQAMLFLGEFSNHRNERWSVRITNYLPLRRDNVENTLQNAQRPAIHSWLRSNIVRTLIRCDLSNYLIFSVNWLR